MLYFKHQRRSNAGLYRETEMNDVNPENYQEQPVAAEVVQRRIPIEPVRRSSKFGRLLLVFALLALFGSLMLNILLFGTTGFQTIDREERVEEQFYSHERNANNKVAILTIKGTILDNDGFLKRQIDHARKDKAVKAVVLRVNSPGGTITASDYLYHRLTELRQESGIPLVVSMGGIAASGGYYVSMAVGDTKDSIFAEPTTWTGSIGVVIPHYDLSKLLDNWGIEEDSIASHRLKTMGSFARAMTKEERAIFQELVNLSFDRFKEVIRSGRPKFHEDPGALSKLATGQIFTAGQAKQNGLIDKIGFMENAIDRAIQLTGLSKKEVKVVRYRRKPNLATVLFGRQSRTRGLALSTLLDMTSPRAFYLCTWLPTIASSN